MSEKVTSITEKWDGFDLYPKVKVEYWNSDKDFGFCNVDNQKYYLDTRDVYPALNKGNPQTDSKYELHLVSTKRPRKSGQNPSATCVWGKPKSTSIAVPVKSGDGIGRGLAYLNEDGTLNVSSNIEVPIDFDLKLLEVGAGYEVGDFDGTRVYSSLSILGAKKMSVEEVQKEREDKKYMPMINAYNKSLSQNINSETGIYLKSEGSLPENTKLEHKGGWKVKLENEYRYAFIDGLHNRLIIRPVTERVTEKYRDSPVDDFGDFGQAFGAGSTRLIGTTSTREVIIKPSRVFDLPEEILKVRDNNSFENVSLDKILVVQRIRDSKHEIPFLYVAADKEGNKMAFWSRKYDCWRKFTDENKKFLDDVKEYDDKHYTSSINHDDPWIENFFSMIRMAKLQEMDINNIAPWLEKTN